MSEVVRYTWALLGAVTCSASSCAVPGPQPVAGHSVTASFACEGGKNIHAVLVTGSQPGVTLTLSDGRELVLPQAPSASGARYANHDESFVFWNKGRTAFVEEAGRQTYTGCVQTP